MNANDRIKAILAGMRHCDPCDYDAYGAPCGPYPTPVPVDTLKSWALPEDLR